MSGGQRQAVAIARTRLSDAKIVLDGRADRRDFGAAGRRSAEPHSAACATAGVAIVLISHRMPDVFTVADRVVVLRRGSKVADKPIGASSPEEVTGLITGAIDHAL